LVLEKSAVSIITAAKLTKKSFVSLVQT